MIDCQSLDAVRVQIDGLHRQLVHLLAERTAYVKQAARFKADVAAVQAPQRVAQVIGKSHERGFFELELAEHTSHTGLSEGL